MSSMPPAVYLQGAFLIAARFYGRHFVGFFLKKHPRFADYIFVPPSLQ